MIEVTAAERGWGRGLAPGTPAVAARAFCSLLMGFFFHLCSMCCAKPLLDTEAMNLLLQDSQPGGEDRGINRPLCCESRGVDQSWDSMKDRSMPSGQGEMGVAKGQGHSLGWVTLGLGLQE